MLDGLVAELPPEIFTRLNGGVLLLPDVKLSAEAKAGDLFTLGEYENSYHLGRTVRIYYGSILRARGNLPPDRMREELRRVLRTTARYHLDPRPASATWRWTTRCACNGIVCGTNRRPLNRTAGRFQRTAFGRARTQTPAPPCGDGLPPCAHCGGGRLRGETVLGRADKSVHSSGGCQHILKDHPSSRSNTAKAAPSSAASLPSLAASTARPS